MSVDAKSRLAVALHYDKTGAPRVVAKGKGTIGDKIIELDGNGDTTAVIYAPNAEGRFWGNADFFGSVIMREMEFGGNTRLTYDRALQQSFVTAGNPVMTSFTWRTF